MIKVLTRSKALIALMLVLMLGASMALTGCGSNEEPAPADDQTVASEQFEDALKEAADEAAGTTD